MITFSQPKIGARVYWEEEEQEADNIIKVLKESILQLKSRVNVELKKKKAIKFYIS